MPTFNSMTLRCVSVLARRRDRGKGTETAVNLQRGENGGQVPCKVRGLVELDPKVQAEDTRDASAVWTTQFSILSHE